MPTHSSALELAPEQAWFKSSFSDPGQNCLEVADLPLKGIGVRDSKNPSGPALLLPPTTWTTFVTHIRDQM